MTFVASHFERFKDRVLVWEKEGDKRIVREYKSPHYFYVPDKEGPFTAITGEKLKKLTFGDKASFDEACISYPKKFESDISPQEKVMMDMYAGKTPPTLNIGFVDIEVDYDPKVPGGAQALVGNPYAPINALTIYLTDVQHYFCFAVPPPGWSGKIPEKEGRTVFICRDERELLDKFFDVLESSDLIAGWNSDFFDLPYIGKRVELLYGESGLKKLGFERGPMPRWTEQPRFKNSKEKDVTLDINSRPHLDYMRLFKKFNLQPRQSHSLAAIAAEELKIPKHSYDGTLHELYNNNFEFFVEYNIRDVEILVQIDEKFKYIELANNMVHEATVNFSAIFGSVQLIDTAIINFAHTKLNKIIFDRTHRPKQEVEGALVLTPLKGLHKWIASCDINSLYPSTYMSLNLSPEMIIGQLLGYESDWRKVYDARKYPENDLLRMKPVKLQIEGTAVEEAVEMTVGELIEMMTEQKIAISAYGTLLDQSQGEGLIPGVLLYWFKGRKELQAKKKQHAKNAAELLKNGKDKKSPEYIEEMRLSSYYDMLQGVRKVLLNSSYGATLNEWCRFHDPRLGASTTGSGRQITTFMLETIMENLCGKRVPIVKTTEVDAKGNVENAYTVQIEPGIGPVMSDTDSCYFLMSGLVNDPDSAIQMADAIVEIVNNSFPGFMREAFNCQGEFDSRIRAVREIVAESGIIRAKKNYVFSVIDDEGTRLKEPKLKLQGGDLKVSSTPEEIRTFLRDITKMILSGVPQHEVAQKVIEFRDSMKNAAEKNPLNFATIKAASSLDEYEMKWARTEKVGLGKINMPGHVRAAINYNHCLDLFSPGDSRIMAGSKLKIVWLTENEYGFTSMAFPSETEVLPQWFTERFQVDAELTEQKMIDQKVGNTFIPIGWEIPTRQTAMLGKLFEF